MSENLRALLYLVAAAAFHRGPQAALLAPHRPQRQRHRRRRDAPGHRGDPHRPRRVVGGASPPAWRSARGWAPSPPCGSR